MTKHVQLTASFEIVDGQNAESTASHLAEALLDAAFEHPGPLRMWVSTLVADEPLPRPDAQEGSRQPELPNLDIPGTIAVDKDPFGRRSGDS
jgi:hypothetical protein